MSTADTAKTFIELYNAGKYDEIERTLWSPNVVSIEAMDGPMARLEGKEAVQAKGEWWFSTHDVHSTSAAGPFVNGDQFAVQFAMDITNKETGERTQMSEVGLYTVKNGQITEERFFY